jgi:hypothetical protein
MIKKHKKKLIKKKKIQISVKMQPSHVAKQARHHNDIAIPSQCNHAKHILNVNIQY